MTDDDMKRVLVRICDPDHPHYLERGYLTGNTISVLGTPMTEVKLEHCRHGTDGCFIRKGQIEVEVHGDGLSGRSSSRAKRRAAVSR